MKTKTILAGLLLVLTMTAGTAFAQSDFQRLQPKSTTTAWILGLDPIPGDALFYAGKRGQATTNMLIGIPGGILFGLGLAMYFSGSPVSEENAMEKGFGKLFSIVGGLIYCPMILWDAIGGISGVYAHNEKVKRRPWLARNVRPVLSFSNQGFMAGAQISF